MAIWVVEFSNGGYKIRKIFAKESTYPKEIFEFWELDEASVACKIRDFKVDYFVKKWITTYCELDVRIIACNF